MTENDDLRMQCLRLAHENTALTSADVIDVAATFHAFVTGPAEKNTGGGGSVGVARWEALMRSGAPATAVTLIEIIVDLTRDEQSLEQLLRSIRQYKSLANDLYRSGTLPK